MPIIDLNAATAIDPLAVNVTLALGNINSQFRGLSTLFANIAKLVWANPRHTPQQVVDAFGANAADLFRLAALIAPVLGEISGTTPNPMPEGWTYTANPDGTVTLHAPT